MSKSTPTASPELRTRARGKAKRDLIAYAAVIPKKMEESADRIRAHVNALREKEITEWDMVRMMVEEISSLPHELDLVTLTAKLVVFQLHDLDARRSMIELADRFGLETSSPSKPGAA